MKTLITLMMLMGCVGAPTTPPDRDPGDGYPIVVNSTLRNPGFEVWVVGRPDGWESDSPGTWGEDFGQSTLAESGSFALGLVSHDGWDKRVISEHFTLPPAPSLRVSFWTNPGTERDLITVHIFWFRDAYNCIEIGGYCQSSAVGDTDDLHQEDPITGFYRKHETILPVPAGATIGRIMLYTTAEWPHSIDNINVAPE